MNEPIEATKRIDARWSDGSVLEAFLGAEAVPETTSEACLLFMSLPAGRSTFSD